MINELILAAKITAFTTTIDRKDFGMEVKQFDHYLTRNYNMLRNAAEQICWNDETYEDILNDNIIRVRTRIAKSGWTCTTYAEYERSVYSYLWVGISNDYKLKKKREKRRPTIEFDNANGNEIQHALEGNEHDSQDYHDSMEVFTRLLFKYLETYYDEKKATLFKTYYLTNANTYHKLAAQSQLDEKYIRQVMSRMKQDIKTNLRPYIKERSLEEVWRPVKHYEGLYEVSNKKRIRNGKGVILNPKYKDVYKLHKDNGESYRSIEQIFKPAFG